jgi:hypothetical protein
MGVFRGEAVIDADHHHRDRRHPSQHPVHAGAVVASDHSTAVDEVQAGQRSSGVTALRTHDEQRHVRVACPSGHQHLFGMHVPPDLVEAHRVAGFRSSRAVGRSDPEDLGKQVSGLLGDRDW